MPRLIGGVCGCMCSEKCFFGGVRELNCVRGGEWSGFVSTGPRTVGAVCGVCGVGAVVCVLVAGVVGGGWWLCCL